MKKFSGLIWVLVAVLVLTAAYIFYSKNTKQGNLPNTNQDISTASPNNNQNTSTDSSDNNQDESTSDVATKEKVMAPDFTLKDLDGKEVSLSDFRGKTVILNFWAVWCIYCKQEMPDLNELNKELEESGEAVLLTVDVQESVDTVKKYLNSEKINVKVLFDTDGSISQAYGVSGFPTTFIINKDGSVYTYIPGATTKETLEEILEKVKNNEPVN